MSLVSDVNETKRVVEPVDVEDCAVCHEPLANNDDERTLVTLRCRHLFHLDCIGSAYNKKNRMECPTCRQIEKGQWLFVNPEVEPSYPEINFDNYVLEVVDEGPNIPTLPDTPTMVWSDSVTLPNSVESHIDRIFLTDHSNMLTSYVPNQRTDNDNTRLNIWRNEPYVETRMQRQIAEHVALIADSERRLLAMMYEHHGITSDRGGESSGGEAVAEEVASGEAAEDADMTEESSNGK